MSGLYYDLPQLAPNSIADIPSPYMSALGATVRDTWANSPVDQLFSLHALGKTRDPNYANKLRMWTPNADPLARAIDDAERFERNPIIDPDEAEQRINAAGLKGFLKYKANMRSEELDLLIAAKRDELRDKSILARADQGFAAQSALFATSLVTAMGDPLNVATAFIPVIGPSRYAYLLGRSPSVLSRMTTRAWVGGIEGAFGQALVEPFSIITKEEYQQDHKLSDTFANIAFGGVLGGGLHTIAGVFADRIARNSLFYRAEGRYADQAYRGFVDEYRAAAAEYGLNTDLAGYRARMLGELEDGFFGKLAKEKFAAYKADLETWGKEFGIKFEPTPEDFLRKIELDRMIGDVRRENAGHELARQLDPVPGRPAGEMIREDLDLPPKPVYGSPTYDLWYGYTGPVGRSFLEDGDVPTRAVTKQKIVSVFEEFANSIPPELREIALRAATERFLRGKASSLAPVYQAFAAQKRLSEAKVLSLSSNLSLANRSDELVYRGDAPAYQIKYSDAQGPTAYLKPLGLQPGDRVEWVRGGVNQLGEHDRTPFSAKIKSIKDGRATLEGREWGRQVPLDELRLIEPGNAARQHALEITWGDLRLEAPTAGPELPKVARTKAAERLLEVLRAEQKFDGNPIVRELEQNQTIDGDLLTMRPDESLIVDTREADKMFARDNAETKLDAIPLKQLDAEKTKTTEPTPEFERVPTPEEDARIKEADLIAAQKAEQHGTTAELKAVMREADEELARELDRAGFYEHYARCVIGGG